MLLVHARLREVAHTGRERFFKRFPLCFGECDRIIVFFSKRLELAFEVVGGDRLAGDHAHGGELGLDRRGLTDFADAGDFNDFHQFF